VGITTSGVAVNLQGAAWLEQCVGSRDLQWRVVIDALRSDYTSVHQKCCYDVYFDCDRHVRMWVLWCSLNDVEVRYGFVVD